MGMDAGTYLITFPGPQAPTEGGLGVSLATAGNGIGYMSVVDGCDMAELGCLITSAPTGGELYATLQQAPTPGGTYVPLYTLHWKTSMGALQVGASVKRYATMRLTKGSVIRWDITIALTAGTGIFYVKAYPTQTSNRLDYLSI
jgi:hypothetical protein